MALLWIKENISAFGGDPTLVTLLGHSAGADSVLHHIVSPKTTNLFHRAIIMSPNDMWNGVNGDMNIASNDAKKASLAIAQSLGCYNGSVSDFQILQCMQVKPLIDIMSLSTNTSWNKHMQPVADDYLSTSEQYLPVTLDIVLNGPNALKPFDILLGTNNLDALNFYDFRMKSLLTKSYSQIHDFAFDKVVPEILKGLSFSEQVLQTLSEAVRWEYWTLSQKQNVEESVKAVEALAAMDSAANWGLGSLMLAKKLSRKVSKLYVYRYNYPSNVDLNGNRLNVTGAVHGTDLIALIGDALMLQVARRPATSDEKRMTKYFRRFVVNFIKFGFPSTQEKWSPFNTNDENIFEVCDSSIGCGPRNIQRDIHFWHYYLPRLSRSTFDGTSSAKFVDQGNRLKGGVFALCGVIVALILLLLASGILLHRRRTYRPSSSLSQIAY
ncbi:acetylcholinesterase-like [Leptidea sinapis]|uniref:acetylcholinesterase-like n=1 Tax=Leptidea sinapis TaxID=189913 RepID=UPI0021C2D13A|nr:acetylcholinesterase-like [Leptidea sinapis]